MIEYQWDASERYLSVQIKFLIYLNIVQKNHNGKTCKGDRNTINKLFPLKKTNQNELETTET